MNLLVCMAYTSLFKVISVIMIIIGVAFGIFERYLLFLFIFFIGILFLIVSQIYEIIFIYKVFRGDDFFGF